MTLRERIDEARLDARLARIHSRERLLRAFMHALPMNVRHRIAIDVMGHLTGGELSHREVPAITISELLAAMSRAEGRG